MIFYPEIEIVTHGGAGEKGVPVHPISGQMQPSGRLEGGGMVGPSIDDICASVNILFDTHQRGWVHKRCLSQVEPP